MLREMLANQSHCLPDKLIGDKTRLKQILINLIKSVMKFSINKVIELSSKYDSKNEKLTIKLDVTSSKVFEKELKGIIDYFKTNNGSQLRKLK